MNTQVDLLYINRRGSCLSTRHSRDPITVAVASRFTTKTLEMSAMKWLNIVVISCILFGQGRTDDDAGFDAQEVDEEQGSSGPYTTEQQEIIDSFRCFANGNYTNKAQVERGDSGASIVLDRFRPVYIPCLAPWKHLYYEENLDDNPFRFQIKVIALDTNNNIILTTLNIDVPEYSKRPAGDVSFDEINKLDCKVLKKVRKCVGKFQRLPGCSGFIGTWEDCVDVDENGKHPHYGVYFGVKSIRGVVPENTHEQATLLPYEMLRVDDYKFDVEDSTIDCKNYCNANSQT